MAKNLDFSGKIHARFDSESAFARHLGWSRQRMWKISHEMKVPDLFELDAMSKALGCSISDLAHIFLPSESPTGDKNNMKGEGT